MGEGFQKRRRFFQCNLPGNDNDTAELFCKNNFNGNSQYFRLLCIFLLTFSSLIPTIQSQERNIEGIIMPGIYMEELDESTTFTTYDKVIPLVFEFKIFPGLTSPSSSSSQTPPGYGNILPRLTCRNENTTSPLKSTNDWLFTCPIFYQINNLLDSFRSNWSQIHPFTFSSSSFSSSLSSSAFRPLSLTTSSSPAATFTNSNLGHSSTSLSLDDDCKSQLRSWRGIDTRSDSGLAQYKSIIEKCSIESYFEESIQDYNIDLVEPYDKLRESLVNSFGNNGTITPWSSTGLDFIAALLGLQNLMTTQLHVETSRWSNVISSCQASLIPTSILKSSRLEKVLQEIRTKLLVKKYNLPFGFSMTKLFKTKLVDCIFGQSSFFIQILLPIVHESHLYKSIQIHQPNFLYGGDTVCYVSSNFVSKGSFFNFRKFIFEKNSKTLIETGCSSVSEPFCKYPDKSSRPATDHCLLAVVIGNMDAIKAYCHLECDPIVMPEDLFSDSYSSSSSFQRSKSSILSRYQPGSSYFNSNSNSNSNSNNNILATTSNSFPLIQRIDSDKFIITLYTMSTMLIKCEALGRLDEFISPQKYGAIEIILPCGCYLMYHSDKYYSYEPCSSLINYSSMYHVIPIHMINNSIEVTRLNVNGPFSSSSGIGNNARFNLNSRLRHLLPRSRITFPNVTLLINMTFQEQQLIEEVIDENAEDNNTADGSGERELSPAAYDELLEGDKDVSESNTTQNPLFLNKSSRSLSSILCNNNNNNINGLPNTEELNANHHSALWSFVIIQGIIISFLIMYILFKFRCMDRKIEDYKYGVRSGGISFSVGGGNGGSASVDGINNLGHTTTSQIRLTDDNKY